MNKKIALIGYGHMGKALVKGLLTSGFKQEHIFISNSSHESRSAVEKADWIFITVKPFTAKTVFEEISDMVQNKILISAVAGLSTEKIRALTNREQKVIRIMPNLPVAHNAGVIGFYASNTVSQTEKKEVTTALEKLGMVITGKKENDLDVVTLIAGCGPAVVSYFINVVAKSGKKFGLTKEESESIALQTFVGTLSLLQNEKQTAEELQKSVATKGGVTEEIIKSLDAGDIQNVFVESLENGYDKIKKLKSRL